MSRFGVLAGVLLSSASLPALASCGPADTEVKQQRERERDYYDDKYRIQSEQDLTLAQALASSRFSLKEEDSYALGAKADAEIHLRFSDFRVLLNAISRRASNIVEVGMRREQYPQLNISNLRQHLIVELKVFEKLFLDDLGKIDLPELKRELKEIFELTLSVRSLIEVGDLHSAYYVGEVGKPNTLAPLYKLEAKCLIVQALLDQRSSDK